MIFGNFSNFTQTTYINESVTLIDEVPIVNINIADIKGCHFITKANYIPNEFVRTKNLKKSEIIDIKEKEVATRGTYIFVIDNLSPDQDDFFDEAKKLDRLLEGDNNWHVSLYLPPCYSACAVYVNSVLKDFRGSFSDYDYISYSDYQKRDLEYKSTTEPIELDLSFYTRINGISPNFLIRSKIITIHYETSENNLAGLHSYPLIGLKENIKSIIETDKTCLTVLTIMLLFMILLFIFVCLLKHSFEFLPYVFSLIGLLLYFSTIFQLMFNAAYPYFILILNSISPYFLLIAFSFIIHMKKVPKIILTLICFINEILSIMYIFNRSLIWAPQIICYLGIGLLLFFVFDVYKCIIKSKNSSKLTYILPVLLAFFVGNYYFYNSFNRNTFNYLSIFGALILVIISLFGISYFIELEKSNRYLTANLELEVNRQTNKLQTLVDEKNFILRYVSHDMKKITLGIDKFINILKKRESNIENIKTIDIIKKKNDSLFEGLTDISKYIRKDIVVEESHVVDIDKLIENTINQIAPDCEANNVKLQYDIRKVKAFAKEKELISIIENLIFNALEHSECTIINIKVYKKREFCYITVSDNGKGLSTNKDIFKPYYSESNNEYNSGLGLYLSRQQIEFMGGKLTYKQSEKELTFIISLPIA